MNLLNIKQMNIFERKVLKFAQEDKKHIQIMVVPYHDYSITLLGITTNITMRITRAKDSLKL